MNNNPKAVYSASKPLASICIQIDDDKVQKQLKKIKEKDNFNLNLGELVIFSIVKGLQNFPMFNSVYDQSNQKPFRYNSVNFGHFVNLGHGPRLAVIKDAETKSLFDISKEIKEAALKYIREELAEEDKKFSTIAITNLYSFPAFQVIPPVYEHQSAMFSITSKFISWDGQNNVHKFNLTLSYDARVADCQTAINFLNKIKKLVEENIL